VTQRQAVPPAAVPLQNTLLPSICKVWSGRFQVAQATFAPTGIACQRNVCAVHRQRLARTRARFLNVTVNRPFDTDAPDR
jgi:hypothetical protein